MHAHQDHRQRQLYVKDLLKTVGNTAVLNNFVAGVVSSPGAPTMHAVGPRPTPEGQIFAVKVVCIAGQSL